MTSTPESRRAAFDRASQAAELILQYEDVIAALEETWAVLAAIKSGTYFAKYNRDRARTPKSQRTSNSVGVIEFGTENPVQLSKHMSTLDERQLAAIANVAVSNGQESGPIIDEARLALDEKFRDDPPIVYLSPSNPGGTTVTVQTDMVIGSTEYRLRSRPTILLNEEVDFRDWQKSWKAGSSFIDQLVASNQILKAPLTPKVDLEDEAKKNASEREDIRSEITKASLGLLTRDVFER